MTRTTIINIFVFIALSQVAFAQAWRWYPVANMNDLFINGVVVTRIIGGADSVIITGSDIGGIFRTTNLGKSWARTNITNAWIRSFTFQAERNIFYAGTFGNGVLRSTDGGKLWGTASGGLTDNFIYSVYAQPGTAYVYAGANGKVFRSSDGGQSWTAFSLGVTAKVNVIETGPDNVTLYAGTENNGLYRSDDYGATWLQLINPMQGLSVVSFIKTAQGDMYAGTKSGLYKLLNERPNWVFCGNGLPGTAAWSIARNQRGWIFACFSSGVYGSTNQGDTWSEVNVGLEDLNVNSLILAGDRDFLFAGTQGGFVFRSEATLTSVKEKELPQGPEVSLFPNPASKFINIKITLPELEKAVIEIYSVTGELKLRTETGNNAAGTTTDGSVIVPVMLGNRFAAGVYFARVIFSGKSRVVPFVIKPE